MKIFFLQHLLSIPQVTKSVVIGNKFIMASSERQENGVNKAMYYIVSPIVRSDCHTHQALNT